jgi:hypothetical protein
MQQILCRTSFERPVARATRAITKVISEEAQPAPIRGIIQALFNNSSEEELNELKVSVFIVSCD